VKELKGAGVADYGASREGSQVCCRTAENSLANKFGLLCFDNKGTNLLTLSQAPHSPRTNQPRRTFTAERRGEGTKERGPRILPREVALAPALTAEQHSSQSLVGREMW
jgi:hypothetical protein